MIIDLHTHSSCSDGTSSPRLLVQEAHAAGIDVLAITDHDTEAGWDEAAETAGEIGLELVRGMEISTRHRDQSVHLLAYLPDPTHPPLRRMLGRVLQGRDHRIPRMVAKLNGLGIPITEELVAAKAGDAAAVGRPHVADVLVDLGVVTSRDEAFESYLAAGARGYVSRPAARLTDAIRVVAAAGGVSVIAHPWGRGGGQVLDADELRRLGEAGLTGVEVDHLDHDHAQRERLRGIAGELDLVVTGSSDYHGLGKRNHPLAACTTHPDQYERLLAAAAEASRAVRHETPSVLR